MSTRSAIVVKTESGFKGIYCHNDGYIEGVGATLFKHYQDPQKIERLIALGDISSLDVEVEPTGPHSYENPQDGIVRAYHRDRGEDWDDVKPFEVQDLQVMARGSGFDYIYLFYGGKWTVSNNNAESFNLLEDELKAVLK